MEMATSMTVKGQVTIPKRFRDLLGLKPGDRVDFVFDEKGQVLVRRAGGPAPSISSTAVPDRFERARGSAPIKFSSTAECMKFLRGDDYEIDGEP
jgi:antitoxin PrlF